MSRQANIDCHSYCGLAYIILQCVQTMGIVLLVLLFVLRKQVFVLVSGCYRSGKQDKEGGIGKWNTGDHGGDVDISLMLA